MSEGTFCLVLHSHLPWLARHGSWPVGEDWLYQAWAHSYLPVVDVLHRLAERGHRDVLTLGVTPVLAAQLDHPYTLRAMHAWLADWQLRAHATHARLPDTAYREHRAAAAALETFEHTWRHGGSPVFRGLADAGVVELLGGPVTHPFGPLLPGRVRRFLLDGGLRDTTRRLGSRPEGIWAPECGYAPGMEREYAVAGVRRFLVDGPALHGDTAAAHPVDGSDVVAFGRDLEVTYRVWSPRSGYPGGPDYRDFHAFDHASGFKPFRVTGKRVAAKAPYAPDRAALAVGKDAQDFVATVVRRLRELHARRGKPGLVVAAYDTELFGHWWHEGPAWLEQVLTLLPDAGVHVTTLRGAVEAGHVEEPVVLPPSSWGSGKDWRVWDGAAVRDMVADNTEVATRLLAAVDGVPRSTGRDATLDALAVQAALALSSDWAFMVTKDSAAHYARRRAAEHRDRVRELTDLLPAGRHEEAARRAASFTAQDDLFGHLDARQLATARARTLVTA
ncbi:glycoside hydrolase family 57 protein [Actinomycetospora corticicola]|uniref:1,4-alpha-glucan branching enzyme n=1 Tax=Actinomycetospora corticicola TaxID=663602 RepID=A0A7Y9DWI7_9PSEU|nr:1,4-alpha-glucan branching protein domain-containing protein [Actinomycetospora corticicola]NYD36721.1 1,4-alpha-glucan branching enzyme [Actinomycetospora corticicola]